MHRLFVLFVPLIFIGCSKPEVKTSSDLIADDAIAVFYCKSESDLAALLSPQLKGYLLTGKMAFSGIDSSREAVVVVIDFRDSAYIAIPIKEQRTSTILEQIPESKRGACEIRSNYLFIPFGESLPGSYGQSTLSPSVDSSLELMLDIKRMLANDPRGVKFFFSKKSLLWVYLNLREDVKELFQEISQESLLEFLKETETLSLKVNRAEKVKVSLSATFLNGSSLAKSMPKLAEIKLPENNVDANIQISAAIDLKGVGKLTDICETLLVGVLKIAEKTAHILPLGGIRKRIEANGELALLASFSSPQVLDFVIQNKSFTEKDADYLKTLTGGEVQPLLKDGILSSKEGAQIHKSETLMLLSVKIDLNKEVTLKNGLLRRFNKAWDAIKTEAKRRIRSQIASQMVSNLQALSVDLSEATAIVKASKQELIIEVEF